ncbi:MAG: L,D-transpeptidase family protein [Panacagrimonas sp.]
MQKLARALGLVACALLYSAPTVAGHVVAEISAADSPEAQLVSALELAASGRLKDSLHALDVLTRRQPNFRLAQLMYAELLAARSGVLVPGARDDDPRLAQLLDEARLRLDQAKFSPAPGSIPDVVLKLSREFPYLVVVDLSRSRLHLIRNAGGELQWVDHRYVSFGRGGFGKQLEGDLRTPIGVYHVNGWKSDASLPDLYGAGALPLSYPNQWDRYQGKTGNGIWLHGVPRETYVRAPRSSEGCVTMANEDVLWLKPYVEFNGAPVVLADEVDWIPQAQMQDERDAFLARIESWRSAWASGDGQAFLDFYDPEFASGGLSRSEFASRQRQSRPRGGTAAVADISLFRYPGERLMLAEFTLAHSAGDPAWSGKKEQFWRQDADGQWRIFREESR